MAIILRKNLQKNQRRQIYIVCDIKNHILVPYLSAKTSLTNQFILQVLSLTLKLIVAFVHFQLQPKNHSTYSTVHHAF